MPYCLLLSTAALSVMAIPLWLTVTYFFLTWGQAYCNALLLVLSLKHIQKLQLGHNVVVQHLNEVSTYCWEHMWVLLLCHIYQLTEDALQTKLSSRNGSVVWNTVVCRVCFVLPVSSCCDMQCCLSVRSFPEILKVRKRYPNTLL